MMIAHRKSFFSSTYLLREGEREAGRVEFKGLGTKGRLVLQSPEGEREYPTKREKLFGGSWVVDVPAGEPEIRAERIGVFKERYHITCGTLDLVMHRGRSWRGAYTVAWNGEEIGTIERATWTGKEVRIDLPEILPLHLRAFLFWLAQTAWNQQAAAAT